MTTLYKPVLIESVKQAEALPDGTIARHPVERPILRAHGRWRGRMRMITDADVVEDGCWEALAPVEAEEEYEEARSVSVLHGSTWTWPARTRLVTPWEAVS